MAVFDHPGFLLCHEASVHALVDNLFDNLITAISGYLHEITFADVTVRAFLFANVLDLLIGIIHSLFYDVRALDDFVDGLLEDLAVVQDLMVTH